MEEVEGDSPEAYQKRRELVKLLVAGITAGKHDDGSPDVRITYRFGPPEPYPEEGVFANGVENGPGLYAASGLYSAAGCALPPSSWSATLRFAPPQTPTTKAPRFTLIVLARNTRL